MKHIYKENKYTFIIIIFIIIYLFRIFHLDIDVVNFNMAQVQPIDELYYNEIAIYLHHHGWKSLFTGELSEITLANGKLLVIPNIITAFTMEILGNNYYGLRMGYICMGLLNGILLLALVKKLTQNIHIIVFVGLLYLCDFNLICLTRSATTVVPCILSLLCTIALFVYSIPHKVKFFILGFLPIFIFMLVYGNMPFLIIFVGLYVLYRFILDRQISYIIFYLIGIATALTISEAVDNLLFRQHMWDVFLNNMGAHGDKLSSGGFSIIMSLARNTYAFPCSNMFRYNIIPLFIMMSSLPLAFRKIVHEKDSACLVLCGLLLMHYCQTVFLNNMTFSKASISFATVLLYIAYIMRDINHTYVREYKRWIMTSGLIAIIIMIISNEKVKAFDLNYRLMLYGLSFLAVSLFIKANKDKMRYCLLLCISLIPMIIFIYNTIVINDSYIDKQMLEDMTKYEIFENTINAKGFNLYNNLKSDCDDYDHYKGIGYNEDYIKQRREQILNKYGFAYYFCYGKHTVEDVQKSFVNKPVTCELIQYYPRLYSEDIDRNNSQNILIYKISK